MKRDETNPPFGAATSPPGTPSDPESVEEQRRTEEAEQAEEAQKTQEATVQQTANTQEDAGQVQAQATATQAQANAAQLQAQAQLAQQQAAAEAARKQQAGQQAQTQPLVGGMSVNWDEKATRPDGTPLGPLNYKDPEHMRMIMAASAQAKLQGLATGTVNPNDPAQQNFTADPMPKVIVWDRATMGGPYTGSPEQRALVEKLSAKMKDGEVARFTSQGNDWTKQVQTTVRPIPKPTAPTAEAVQQVNTVVQTHQEQQAATQPGVKPPQVDHQQLERQRSVTAPTPTVTHRT